MGIAAGQLRMAAARRGERTVLTDLYRTAPFHPGPVHSRQGRAEIIVQDVSPGLFPGDRLAIDVTVHEHAALTVSGQGAARIYPSPDGVASEMATRLRVADGGTLWWLPGDLIPYRDAVYTARTEVSLAASARFALIEILTPGRTAMGERDAYQRLDLRLRIDVAGKPRLIERVTLCPGREKLSAIGQQGSYPCAGLLVAVGYPAPTLPGQCPHDVRLGADGDDQLTIVRGLAQAAAPLRDTLLRLLEQMDRHSPRSTGIAVAEAL